jgi:hypothetical protein
MTHRRWISRPVLILLGILVAMEIIAPFCVRSYGVDGHWNLSFVKQFTGLVAAGEWVPRWVPEGYNGFGSSTFYFYPPLSLYLASIIRIVTGIVDERALFQLTGLVGTVGSLFSASYFLGKLATSKYQQWVGAVLYAFGPMQIAELYSRSSLSTHIGYVFVPFVWAGAVMIVADAGKVNWGGILLLGISAALTALSSVPVAMLTAISMVVVAVVFRSRITGKVVVGLFIAALLAITLFASQLTSVLTAQPYAHLEDVIVRHPEYLISSLVHGGAGHAAYYVSLLYLSVILVLIAYQRDARMMSSDAKRAIIAGVVLAACIAFLEIPSLTTWLWYMVPPFTIIQGIWRFYVQLMLFVAVVVAIASTENMQRMAQRLTVLTAVSAAIPIMLIIFDVHVFRHFEGAATDPTEYRPLSAGSYAQTIEHTEQHQKEPFAVAAFEPADEFWIDSAQCSPSQVRYNVKLSESRLVTFHRFEWPYWRLYVNGGRIATASDSMGRATAVLPIGQYRAEWKLERSSLERAGLWVSGIAWSALLFCVAPVLLVVRYRRKQHSPTVA